MVDGSIQINFLKLIKLMKSFATLAFVSFAQATHFDDVDNMFTNFKFDVAKFKTQTNCQLDTYPEVSTNA